MEQTSSQLVEPALSHKRDIKKQQIDELRPVFCLQIVVRTQRSVPQLGPTGYWAAIHRSELAAHAKASRHVLRADLWRHVEICSWCLVNDDHTQLSLA